MTCWNGDERYPDQEGGFSVVGVNSRACASGADTTITCWELLDLEPATMDGIPSGTNFADVCLSGHLSTEGCALDSSGRVTCWDDVLRDRTPDSLFSQITCGVDVCVGGEDGGCVLDAEGRASCWGPYLTDAPDVSFTEVSCGNTHACGITDAGAMACWGDCAHGQCDVPP